MQRDLICRMGRWMDGCVAAGESVIQSLMFKLGQDLSLWSGAQGMGRKWWDDLGY